MPLHNRKDKQGPYFQWGGLKKYYYNPKSNRSKQLARDKAMKQARAIAWRRYGGFEQEDWFLHFSKKLK